MALNAATNWYVRAGGNALNGGGWDSTISGAGVNYADADAAVLSLTDMATTGAVATVTSAAAGFTANMVGNCLRIASGTNFTAGYYFIITYTNTTTVVLDRACATGVGVSGVGKIGGAFANCAASLSTGGTVTAPAITSPLAAGHTINIRGAGTDNPGSADYTQTGYATYPTGTTATGAIRVIGYNGRPRIDPNGLCFYTDGCWTYSNLMFKFTSNNMPDYGAICQDGRGAVVTNVRVDQAGYDVVGVFGCDVIGCSFINSGSATAGSNPALYPYSSSGYVAIIFANLFSGWRGGAVHDTNCCSLIADNVICNCKQAGIICNADSYTWGAMIVGNTIYGNTGAGIFLEVAGSVRNTYILNNIIYGNTTYGIDASVGTTALNDNRKGFIDYNAFRSNTSGALNALTAGTHDVTLTADPFTNAAGLDFTLNSTAGGGAALKAVGFPGTFPS